MRLRDFFLTGGLVAIVGTASATEELALSQLLTEIPNCAVSLLLPSHFPHFLELIRSS